MFGYDWERVFLYAYPKLGEMAEAEETAAETRAALSFRSSKSALAAAADVAEGFFVARALEAARQSVESALSVLGEEEKYLLEYKYFRRTRVLREKFGGMKLHCTKRTYFRRQAALLRRVSLLLHARGWTEARFREEFSAYEPFLRALRVLRAGREKQNAPRRHRLYCSGSSRGSAERLLRNTSTTIPTTATHAMQMTTICAAEGEAEAPLSAAAGTSSER